MAILQSNRESTLRIQDLNPHITCDLCKGYMIRPTTITECLHTFCRSCLVTFLKDNEQNVCPKCSTVIHETNPFELLRSDQTLEDIIFKLVPGLQENEKRREIEFCRTFNCSKRDGLGKLKHKQIESSDDGIRKNDNKDWRGMEQRDYDQNYHRDDPQIGVYLEYLGCQVLLGTRGPSVRELARKYIRCSSRVTIGHIRKYLKLKLKLAQSDEVEIMCNGELMGKDHTLEFVYMTRWRVKENPLLTLQYRPKLDFQ